MNENLIILIATAVIAVANIVLIYFNYKQARFIHKPVITTKVISRREEIDDKPSVLEWTKEPLYLVVSNISNNPASDIQISQDFLLGGELIAKVTEKLDYLNPGEATKVLLGMGEVIKKHPELFEEIERGNVLKKIPKKTLELLLNVTVSFNSPKYVLKDSYAIEWGSLENYPNFEDHPVCPCWNRRNDLYIYKTGAV